MPEKVEKIMAGGGIAALQENASTTPRKDGMENKSGVPKVKEKRRFVDFSFFVSIVV